MGYCCSKQNTRKVDASTIYYGVDVKYPRKTCITIKKRNSRDKIIFTQINSLLICLQMLESKIDC